MVNQLRPVVPTNICGVPVSGVVRQRILPFGLEGLLIPAEEVPSGVSLFEYQILLATGVILDTLTLQFPTRIQFTTFPVDGSFALLPAGQTLIDLENGVATNDVGNFPLINDQEVLSQIRSISVVADGPVEVRMEPNLGSFRVSDGVPLIGNGKRVGRVVLDAGEAPVMARVAMSTGVDAPNLGGLIQAQYRFADQILTKTSAAATQDGLTALTIRPRWRDDVLAVSLGKPFFFAEHIGQKTFLIRNLGPGEAEVQLLGAMFKSIADDRGYIADTDSGGVRQTIASGDNLILESGIPYSVMQLGAAVAQAEAAAQTARLIVEYKGMSDRAR